jgi:hypothetical protein
MAGCARAKRYNIQQRVMWQGMIAALWAEHGKGMQARHARQMLVLALKAVCTARRMSTKYAWVADDNRGNWGRRIQQTII